MREKNQNINDNNTKAIKKKILKKEQLNPATWRSSGWDMIRRTVLYFDFRLPGRL